MSREVEKKFKKEGNQYRGGLHKIEGRKYLPKMHL